eukprot:TRINITY_DN4044_c0_g1_i1.p1 TRINITY_DN4044_c0_g1~~TRINITY_DN4044_c0_g1_i1.p1  ORF type:complete len:317 (-),score=41.57 TRINITY_DN4044_c0_g1_i1:729-1679(-)
MNPSPDPSLKSVLDQKSLKWIFVGGKGGVGKTTTSCCLAIQLSKVRDNVLLISTDPAHNLSDALEQKFSHTPSLVNGFKNLYAMEVESNAQFDELSNFLGPDGAMFQDIASSIPGIDEAMSFTEVIKLVKTMEFSVVVFDTAPTGHTLRFLSLPTTLEKSLGKLLTLKNKFSGMFKQFSTMFGMPEGDEASFTNKFDEMRKVIGEVNQQFKNADLTTFVCVCIPEFLSLYETERMIQELSKFEIDVQNVVVNQVLFPDKPCTLCQARSKMQKKYLDQINDLYEDFHVVKMPLLESEIRGTESLSNFSNFLMNPYKP